MCCRVFHRVPSWDQLCSHSLYINDLPQDIVGVTTVLFTNDATMYVVGHDLASICDSLCSALHLADEWICANQCSSTLLTKGTYHAPLAVHLNGSLLEQVQSMKFLGVIINDTLSWSDYIKYVSFKLGC